MTFSGFDRAAVALLDELPSWSSEEFEAHKRQLHDGLSEPGRALITDLAARLDAKLTVDSRSSVSPLHRDLRFAPAGSARYKDHLLLTTWDGADKRTSPTLGSGSTRVASVSQRTRFHPDVPVPFGADHPRAALPRLAGFQVRFTNRLADTVATPDLADWCAERLEELLPVHRWLLAHIAEPRPTKG